MLKGTTIRIRGVHIDMPVNDFFFFHFLMQEVLRNLVKRYVAAMIRDAKKEEGLTEENFKVMNVLSLRMICFSFFSGGQKLYSCHPGKTLHLLNL